MEYIYIPGYDLETLTSCNGRKEENDEESIFDGL
jgi:hypothetical protein